MVPAVDLEAPLAGLYVMLRCNVVSVGWVDVDGAYILNNQLKLNVIWGQGDILKNVVSSNLGCGCSRPLLKS